MIIASNADHHWPPLQPYAFQGHHRFVAGLQES
jgi:hypothetical protein